jgi:hypothetical protein
MILGHKEDHRMEVTAIASIGIDLGKTTFHLVALDCHAGVILRKKFSRSQLLAYTANLPCCLIGMEACSGAHFLGAKLRAQGPGRAPFGYRNNREKRSIEVHPENSKIVQFIFERYATGQYSLITLRKAVREQLGRALTRSYLHTILTNPAYIGIFDWAGTKYRGTHETFISPGAV